MKKLVSVILVLCFALLAVSAETLSGGWALSEDVSIPEEAQTALDKALEGYVGASFEPVAYLGSQVVAGTNYALLCTCAPVVPDAVAHYAIVYVYADLQGGAEILRVQDIELSAQE